MNHKASLFAFEPKAKGSEQVFQILPETLRQDEAYSSAMKL
ncbi:hypothetical protein SAMN05444149_101144 [Pseudosulfitobacter pseudonitzschiae]|nr:hypothetical protein SAMN05444149_101144 [Pseudosulfitobacter pseudonitzschiae]